MQKIAFLLLVSFCLVSCKKNKVSPGIETKTDLLVKNNWVIEKFTAIDNSTIAESKLNTNAKLLYLLEFQFRSNNKVNAFEKTSKQIINGGNWFLTNNEKNLSIDIPGLKDDFELIEISKSKLVIRPNEQKFPVVDNSTKVNMVFIPSL